MRVLGNRSDCKLQGHEAASRDAQAGPLSTGDGHTQDRAPASSSPSRM